jgi:hypothetical protein
VFQAQKVAESQSVLNKLSVKQLVQLDVDGLPPPNSDGNPYGEQPTLPTVLDAWGRPIRFVHPKADGLIVGAPGTTGSSNEAQRRVESWLGPVRSTPEIERRYIINEEIC